MKQFYRGLLALFLFASFSGSYAQVANDDCATAQNLGTLPTPQSCTSGPIPTRGIGNPQTFNLTSTNATPSSPYISMTGCQAGNASTSSPASDVWYQVTTTGSDLVVNITGGINQPNIALWQGVCGSLVGVGCATGTAGNLNTTFSGLPPGVYYIQISGNNVNDRGNFSLTLRNNNNCAACLIQQNLTVSPLPTNGFYPAGTVVNFCFNITQWTTVSANWLNGVEITFGNGWNVGSIVATPPANCDGSVGTWGYYPAGITSSANGSVWGPGFYFDRNNDGNPGNDFGDNCSTGSPNIGNWRFCFSLTARSDCGAPGFSPDLSLVFNTNADGESGSWTSIACQNDPDIFFSAQITCCPQPLTVNTNASCFGACNGTATATGQGTGPWNYTWINLGTGTTILTQNNIAGPANITGLCAGTYVVQTFDVVESCTARDTFIVTQPTQITSTPAIVNVLCNGGATGSITMNATAGGVGPYQYSLNGGPFQVGNSFTGLAAGTYTVTVRDATGCTRVFAGLIVTQPAALAATSAVVHVLCNGGNTGSITINGTSGGVGPYQYSLNGGPFQASNVFPNLTAGTYTVTVRDANLCTLVLTNVIVNQPPAITATPTIVHVLCNGGNTGSITVNATAGGVGPYQYSLNGGPFQASNVFPNLTAGTYTVTVRDANLCTRVFTNLIVNQPPAIAATSTVVHVLCNGGNTGSITINGTSGGVAPYQYSLNGGPFQASNVFPNLTAGTYTVTVRDANLCTLVLTNIIVNQPAAITATPTIVHVLCNSGNTGSITINATAGGVGPYQYSLNGGPFQASNVFPNLTAGTYTVTVRDANLCTRVFTNLIVNQPAAITATSAVVNVLCNGGNTGSITINGTAGGTAPYQYSLNGGPFQASNVFPNLSAGTYTVTVRDANLCTLTLTNIIVNQPAPLAATSTVVNVACNGGNTGSITINGASGGVGPYQFSLNGGPFQASNVFPNLTAGTYTVTVRDANLCTLTLANIIVSQPAAITGTAAVVNVLCNGGNTGSITINGTAGGTAPYQYSLNGGPFQASNVFPNLTAGTYTVTIRDANLCTITLTNIVVNQPAALAGTPAIVNVTCNGANNGSITINATTGGTAPYQYSLNGGPLQAGNAFTGLAPGVYTVMIQDANGCTLNFANLNITEPAAISANDSTVTASCVPGADGEIWILNTTGGTAPYQYSLNGGPLQSGNSFLGLNGGTYTVTVLDANGCTFTLSNVTVPVPGGVSGNTNLTMVTCNGGNNGQITVNATGGSAPFQYSINGGPLQASNIFPNLTAGTYTVLIVDAFGCSTTLSPVITEPAAITGTSAMVNVSCNGANDGSITINGAGGGTAPYQYSLNGGPLQSGNSFTGLSGGTYTVNLQDANGCFISFTNILISEPSAITANDSVVGASCNPGNDGEVWILNVSGGTGPYSYSIDGGTLQASNSFTGLSGGSHSVLVQDANGCQLNFNSTVPSPGNITAVDSLVMVTCPGGNDGEIWLNASSSNPPITYSLNGGPIQAANNFTGLVAGTYSVAATDLLGCTVTLNVNITAPAAIQGTPAVTDVLCNGGTTGEITINGTTGGTSPYTYSLNGGPAQAGNTFTGLPAGTYSVNIIDSRGCSQLLTNIIVAEPTALVAMANGTDPNCNGGNDGSITVSGVSGGNGPYQYSLNGGPLQATGIFNGLSAGTYTALVQDNNGCTLTLPQVILANPVALTASDSTMMESCNPGSDGEVWIINVAGGTGPYQYSLDGGALQASNGFMNLIGGAHTALVQDANGCTLNLNVVVPTAGSITASDSLIPPSCPNTSNGEIWVNATTSFPPLQYSLNGGPLQSSNSFTGLSGGNYTVDVTDAFGCLATLNITLIQPSAIVSTDSVVDLTCFGSANGEIWLNNTSGGTGPYQFALNGGSLQAANSFTGLTASIYDVLIQDANGCRDSILGVLVNQPNVVSAQDSIVNASCNIGGDGEIWILNASGGNGVFTYSLDGGAAQSGNSFTNVTAGNHVVVVADGNGCSLTLNVTVVQPGGIQAIGATTLVSCFGGTDGTVTVTTSAGTAPFQYSLNGGTFGGSSTFTGLVAGPVEVTVQDSFGCLFTVFDTILEPNLLSATDSLVMSTCNGADDAEIWVLNAAGGTPGYSYSINGGAPQVSNSFVGLAPGTYAVTLIDNNGCTILVDSAIVTEPSLISGTTTFTPVSCNGGSDGTITVQNVAGGTPGYTFSVDGTTFQQDTLFTGLPSGNYTVTIRDTNGCTFTILETIVQPTPLNVVLSSQPATCGNNDGSALAFTGGGVLPYSYAWSNGVATSNPFLLYGGMYSVTVTDANGCQTFDSILVADLGAPSVSITNFGDVSCAGGNDGFAVATASLGIAPYSYAWSTTLPVNTDSVTGLTVGTYFVTVTDSTGCSATDSVTIAEPSPISIVVGGVDPRCFGLDDGQAFVVATGGTPNYSYLWSSSPTDTNSTVTGLFSGSYQVVVTDANGCSISDSVTIVDPPMVNAAFTSNPNLPATLEIPNANVSFSNQSQNAVFYNWTFGDGGSSNDVDPSHVYNDAGVYCVELIARDSAGCRDTLEVCAFTVVITEFVIPNTFTPNNDGRNDFFQIVGIEQYPNNHLQVFNRWGNLIYEKAQYDNSWSGNNYKTGDPLPDGAYFYIFKTGVEGQEDLMGDVVIFR